MIYYFEDKATIEQMEDLAESGFILHSCNQIKSPESEKCLFYKIDFFNQSQDNVYNSAIHLTSDDSELYVLPIVSIGEILVSLLLFSFMMFFLVKWIGTLLFKNLIDFKNRR